MKHKFVETKVFLTPAGLLHLTFYEINLSGRKKIRLMEGDFDVSLLGVSMDI